MNWKVFVALTSVIAGMGALAWNYLGWYAKPESEISNKLLLTTLFGLFVATLGIDLVTKAFYEFFEGKQKNEILKRIDGLPSLILGQADIVVLGDRNAGFRYCIETVPNAKSVKNNILRYGEVDSANPSDTIYAEWRDAKKNSVQSLETSWKEIVSVHLKDDDPQILFARAMSEKGSRYYGWERIDDRECPMVQLTLFEFDQYAEVIFGWEFPGSWRGACMVTRNADVVKYFDRYFDHHYALAKEQREKRTLTSAVSDEHI